ncbi:Sensors of blue-light using FAD [Hymenobacter gelipurpurascens]|uniref:Sensors of blue-light using FAD n=1 Tax=Hymenobacter gelipurpurascens TaxID=89968 RepID=A0A212TIR4_9BACT|nr:BLUF domain-containing protein [Hymenobacter gelipurpurascens]SNC65744.1 Sensors of blue-light using FAD [Hymenobacter gelipurpurascens]
MPVTALHHLVYQSSATTSLSEKDLEAILTQSRAWNHAHELTGVLLYSNEEIMQVLEGPEEEVRYIFQRIEQDNRHYRVTKLSDGPIQERNFAQWSMGFKAVNPEDFQHLLGYLNPTQDSYLADHSTNTDASLYAMLSTFVTEDEIRF